MTLSRCKHFVSRQDFIEILSDGHGHDSAQYSKEVEARTSRSYAGRQMLHLPPSNEDRNANPSPKKSKAVNDTVCEKHVAKAEAAAAALSAGRPAWDSAAYDPAAFNKTLGKAERHVFSGSYPRPLRDQILGDLQKAGKINVDRHKKPNAHVNSVIPMAPQNEKKAIKILQDIFNKKVEKVSP